MSKFITLDALSRFKSNLDTLFNTKVDKVTGKGLSTEDFTTAEKTKLAGLENYDDSTIIASLDTKVDKVTGKGLSTEDFTTAEKTKLAEFGAASTYATKSDIVNVYKYKGSVADYSSLPSSGQTGGDVYDVQDTGTNYAWSSERNEWDPLGMVVTIVEATNAEIDALFV